MILTLALVSGATLACDPPEASQSLRSEDDPSPDGDGCTRDVGYWKTHHAGAKNPHKQQPWPLPDTVVCGQTWLEILHTPPKGDPWVILARQWIAACLNVGAGATAPEDDALTVAEAMLGDCSITDDEHDAALALAQSLRDYNNGEVGPGACEEELPVAD